MYANKKTKENNKFSLKEMSVANWRHYFLANDILNIFIFFSKELG